MPQLVFLAAVFLIMVGKRSQRPVHGHYRLYYMIALGSWAYLRSYDIHFIQFHQNDSLIIASGSRSLNVGNASSPSLGGNSAKLHTMGNALPRDNLYSIDSKYALMLTIINN